MEWKKIEELEAALGYSFQDKSLLKLALTHSSYGHEVLIKRNGPKDNERLEFLGDAVLELITSEYLYKYYKNIPEGQLSKIRASLVCEPTLAACARTVAVDEYILLGKGEKLSKGNEKDSIVSDAFEAIIGAVYLDGGLDRATELVNRLVLTDIENKRLFYDAKTELQIMVQNQYQCFPVYEVIAEDGPPHDKSYTVRCMINDEAYGVGSGNSKKQAQQHAAYDAILNFRKLQG